MDNVFAVQFLFINPKIFAQLKDITNNCDKNLEKIRFLFSSYKIT
jgi:hypothetical protein